LEIIENYVFSAAFPSLPDLRFRARGEPLALAVFAYEYAPAIDTLHRRHADMCFSRTGISRIGNCEANYIPKSRGYLPNSQRTKAIHVVPARFGTFIASLRKGNKHTIGPERFQDGDGNRDFWVPIHKVFSGRECIQGFDIDLQIISHHVNEKIRRLHLALQSEGVSTGWTPTELENPPFRITEDLANFDDLAGLLTPLPHSLVEPAKLNGKYVGFPVPHHHVTENATLWFKDYLGARRWPEFVHAKHAIRGDKIVYLPDCKDSSINDIVRDGGYTALNFVDRSADGWIELACSTLAIEIPCKLSAYSIIAQPDFFPLVKQQDLMEWWENSVPPEMKENLWPARDVTPSPLSECRCPANFTLAGAHFDSRDNTITAIIGMERSLPPGTHISPIRVRRESTLSYRASNLFGPGWDSSVDFNRDTLSPNGAFHLANYGLASPFLEDTLICAANGAFWPGAVPDVTRFFPPGLYPTVTPFYDGEYAWDKLPMPKQFQDGNLEYRAFPYADYVKLVCDDAIEYEKFAETSLEDYVTRTFVVARVYQALGATTPDKRAKYSFLRFRPATPKELEVLFDGSVILDQACSYYLRLAYITGNPVPISGRFNSVTIKPDKIFTVIAGPTCVTWRDESTNEWIRHRI
jgi:hypothetical protein